MKIESIEKVKVCKECGVLFIPRDKHFHTCPHCFDDSDYRCNATEADIY